MAGWMVRKGLSTMASYLHTSLPYPTYLPVLTADGNVVKSVRGPFNGTRGGGKVDVTDTNARLDVPKGTFAILTVYRMMGRRKERRRELSVLLELVFLFEACFYRMG